MAILGPADPFANLIEERAASTPDAIMAVDECRRRLTFGAYRRAVEEGAAALSVAGVGPESRVAWQLPTWLETLILTGALARIGSVQIPIPSIYRDHEVSATVGQTGADLLLTPGTWRGFDYGAMATKLATAAGLRLGRLDRAAGMAIAPPTLLEATAPRRVDRPELDPEVKWIFLTSGTASAPKGAMHTDRSVIAPSRTMTDAFGLTPEDRSAVAFPLAHVGGINWLVACLLSGCRLLLSERFDDAAISFFDAEGVTMAGVSTAFHLAYRDRARRQAPEPLFPRVRAYPGGGATKPPSLHFELVAEVGGVGIVSGYGLTECPMITMARVDDPAEKLAATEGRPSPGVVVKILGTDGTCLGPGQPGLIWARGPQQFKGYVDPVATAEVVDADGFLNTGDIGYLDADGYMVITGRAKDVIIRKGENISAKEVEDHLYEHPSISDVAVIGLPDAALGERCCAVIALAPGARAPSVDELGRYLAERGLMPQKWPEQIEVAESLPRNASSKIMKHLLAKRFSGTTP